MIKRRHSLLALAAAVALTAAWAGASFAQGVSLSRSPSLSNGINRSPGLTTRGGGGGLAGRGGGGLSNRGGGGFRGGNLGTFHSGWHDTPGIIERDPQTANSDPEATDGKKTTKHTKTTRHSRRHRTRQSNSTTSAATAAQMLPDQVVIEISSSASQRQIDALRRRHRLVQIESQTFDLSGSRMFLWRILGGRSVARVVRELEAERIVISAQGNNLFITGQGDKTANEGRFRNMNWQSCGCRRRTRWPKATGCWWR